MLSSASSITFLANTRTTSLRYLGEDAVLATRWAAFHAIWETSSISFGNPLGL
jgi:hypothetical protein